MTAAVGNQRPVNVPDDLEDIPEGPSIKPKAEIDISSEITKIALKAVVNQSLSHSIGEVARACEDVAEAKSPKGSSNIKLAIGVSAAGVKGSAQYLASKTIDKLFEQPK